MKRFVFACAGAIALAGLIGAAHAADLSRPAYTGPPIPPAPYYGWTGFYLGINGGGAWGSSSWDSTGSFDTSGGLFGGTIGYNWQTGPWVFGLEGDIDWADIKGTTNGLGCFGGGCSSENTWLGTARGRLGYAFDRWMPYVTGGAAFGDVEATHAGATGQSSTQFGWTAGAGFEFAVVNNLTAKVEYLHYDLGSFQCGLNCGNGFVNDNVDFNANVVRGGLNLRF